MNIDDEQFSQHRHYQLVSKALHYIQRHQQQQPELADIAAHCCVSPHHLQRVFSQWAGVSPKTFLQLLTQQQARRRLLAGESTVATAEHCRLSSTSRLYDLTVKLEAVTPGELKSGGVGLTLHWGVQPCPFGFCFIVQAPRGLHRLSLLDDEDITAELQALTADWPKAQLIRDPQQTQAIAKQIFYSDQANELPLWLKGSPFQLKVWQALLEIPSGRLSSYGDIALSLDKPGAARAVGSAIGKNPVALLIPCHRVIQKLGGIGQYRWGEVRKRALIGREAAGQ